MKVDTVDRNFTMTHQMVLLVASRKEVHPQGVNITVNV